MPDLTAPVSWIHTVSSDAHIPASAWCGRSYYAVDSESISASSVQVDVPAPATLQPLADLSFMPPADTPEAAFDMIAAVNLQPAAMLDLNSTPEAEDEDTAAPAADPEDALRSEPYANLDQVLPELEVDENENEEEEEEEIPLDQVHLCFPIKKSWAAKLQECKFFSCFQ